MIPCGQRSGTDAQVREEVYGGRGEESVKVQGKAAMSEMKWARQQWRKRQKQKQKTVVCHGGFGGDQGARRTNRTDFCAGASLKVVGESTKRRKRRIDQSTSQPIVGSPCLPPQNSSQRANSTCPWLLPPRHSNLQSLPSSRSDTATPRGKSLWSSWTGKVRGKERGVA